MKYIVSVSGGLGSAEALKRTIDAHGKDNVVAVFADVKGDASTHFFSQFPEVDKLLHERFGGESRDTYRFIWELSHHFDIPVERLEDGRTVFSVFAKSRAFRVFSGGVFVHKCSELLKREHIAKYIEANYKAGEYEIVLGMGWLEGHRVENAQGYWRRRLGWDVNVTAPNMVKPYADNCNTEAWLSAAGIEVPKSYSDGFEHNNCGGGCIAAGQTHYAQLHKARPLVYAYWQYMEMSLNRYWGKDAFVTILKDERGGTSKPMSLAAFEERIKVGDYPKLDWGGCGCFAPMWQPALLGQEAA